MRLSEPVEVKAQLAAAGSKHSELVARLASLEKDLTASAAQATVSMLTFSSFQWHGEIEILFDLAQI